MAGTATISWLNNTPQSVILDAVYPGAVGASVSAGASLSFNHTCNTGNKRLLILAVSLGQTTSDASIVLSATYNSVSMTSLSVVHSNGGTRGYTQMFYLVNPSSGVNSVDITVTGGLGVADLTAGSISFNNVDQSVPLTNTTTATGSSTAPSVSVTSAAGNKVIDVVCCGSDINSTGQSYNWLKNLNLLSAGGNGASSLADGSGSVTMSYSVTSDEWAIIGTNIVYSP